MLRSYTMTGEWWPRFMQSAIFHVVPHGGTYATRHLAFSADKIRKVIWQVCLLNSAKSI